MSYLLVGNVFEYSGTTKKHDAQHVKHIAEQLQILGLVMDELSYAEANVRRMDDPQGTLRYKAILLESSGDEEYHDFSREPWHVYVGKIISEDHGAVAITTLEEALREVRIDFHDPKILHLKSPHY